MKLSKKNADNTPETITDYLPISTPSIYTMLFLLLTVLVVVLIWGNIGRVPLKMTVKGVGLSTIDFTELEQENMDADETDPNEYDVDMFLCLVNPSIITGDKLNDKPATVILNDGKHISGRAVLLDTVPSNEDEVMEILSKYEIDTHWAIERLDTGGYRYIVSVYLDKPVSFLQYGEIADVVIEIDQVPPIHLLKN